MPWIHYHVGDKGMAKACCIANIPYGNTNETSFKEIWNGKPIQELRAKFLKGEKDNRCAGCYKLEGSGGKSIRQETFEKFPDFHPTDIKVMEKPIYFDIRFSNVCNFRCRTCWHGSSSSWFKDAKILGREVSKKAIIQNITDFQRFISETGEALLGAKEIYFAGGEPLVTEEHYLLLDWLIKHNKTSIYLRYNTNFSKLNFKEYSVLKYWKLFDRVEVMASVDATEELGEYIRKEFNWKQFLDNREKLRGLSNVTFKLSPTVSVLNMRHLPELYRTSTQLEIIEPKDFYINILERPSYYNIKAFPKEKKKEIALVFTEFFSWANSNSIPAEIIASFKECLNFMNYEELADKHWPQFIKETEILDKLREEIYIDLFKFIQ